MWPIFKIQMHSYALWVFSSDLGFTLPFFVRCKCVLCVFLWLFSSSSPTYSSAASCMFSWRWWQLWWWRGWWWRDDNAAAPSPPYIQPIPKTWHKSLLLCYPPAAPINKFAGEKLFCKLKETFSKLWPSQNCQGMQGKWIFVSPKSVKIVFKSIQTAAP